MNKHLKRFFSAVFFTGFAVVVYAQYPDIPDSVQKRSDALLGAAQRHSDSAWAIAYPIIEKEAKQGKPYIPWASRLDELPQSEIPAFPGAEGGGKFSFGGRGGKTI
jgi:hypothetical protein